MLKLSDLAPDLTLDTADGEPIALTDISLVVSAHTFGMFAFSIVSGRLTDW